MGAEGEPDIEHRDWQDFEQSSSSSPWLRLVSTSPLTSPKALALPPAPTKASAEAVPIPRAAPTVPPSNASSAGSYEADRALCTAADIKEAADPEEDPWSALRRQLQQAIEPLVEAGADEIDAYSFKNDMDKRLAEGMW